jgi:hypothetical protein
MSLKATLRIFVLLAAIGLAMGPRALALSSAEAGQTSKDVDLQLELLPSAMSGNPDLLVQLDNPGVADGTETTFAGLEPGVHTARVILMDEQNQPLQGGVAMIHFRVHATTEPPYRATAAPLPVQGAPAPPPVPPELRSDSDPVVPLKSSPLLLVSMIGFALLIGSILPGIRSRRVALHP